VQDRDVVVHYLARSIQRIFSPSLDACRGTLIIVLTAASFVVAGTRPSFSTAKCEHPDVFGRLLVAPENRLGELRISLPAPDFSNAPSVRRHLIFSSVLGRLLGKEMLARSRADCEVVATSSAFPDLWALLITNAPSKDASADHARCLSVLQGVLRSFHPSAASITKAAEDAGWIASRVASDMTSPVTEASSLLAQALRKIYEPGSLMHTLVALDPGSYRETAPNEFLDWFESQQLASGSSIIALSECLDTANGITPANSVGDTLPSSALVSPGTIVLSDVLSEREPTPALRHVVIVGIDPSVVPSSGLNAPAVGTDVANACDRSYEIATEVGGELRRVGVRCLKQIWYRQAWLEFYCDAKDCPTAAMSERFARTLVGDPQVRALALAQRASGARGPFLIKNEARSR